MKIEKIYKNVKKAVKHGLIPHDTVNNASGYYNGEYPGRDADGFRVVRSYGSGCAYRDDEIEVYYEGECLLYHHDGWCEHSDETEYYDESPQSVRSRFARKIWELF